jgi:uncharacterized protein YecE (DUF72 family)
MGAADGSWILVGCCGWQQARARYFAQFPAIELQGTFYQPPALELARRWRGEATPGFRFSMKAWQLITHPASSLTYRRLKDPIGRPGAYGFFRPTTEVAAAWQRTLAVARALEAETIVFQCPASFKENDENLANLEAFFRVAEREGRIFAWEPRGPWHAAVVRERCEKLGLVHCVDPFQAEPVAGHAVYLRLHGRGAYRYQYTDDDLIELRNKVLRYRDEGRRPIYVMFNNTYMKEHAARFLQLA